MRALGHALKVSPEVAGRETARAMLSSVLVVERAVVKGTPVNEGRARNAVSSSIQGDGANLMGIVAGEGVEYLPYLETGTRPHMPPIEPIERWVRQKGLWQKDVAAFQARRKAGKLSKAYKAAEKGRKARRFNVPRDANERRSLLRGVERVKEAAIERIAWAVALKIKRDGTPAFRMFENGWKTTKPLVEKLFDQAWHRVLRSVR
jgi:hypothetical protein